MKSYCNTDELRINIGCGTVAAGGWLNIDKSPNAWLAKHRLIRRLLSMLHLLPESTYSTNYRADLLVIDVHKKGLPVPDNSASWIYFSHLIGSMSRPQALRLFEECYRVLQPGGRIRVVTPDLHRVAVAWRNKCQAYLDRDREFFQ